MRYQSITATALALCGFFSQSSAATYSLKKNSLANCAGNFGDTREYISGTCYDFYQSDHGVKIERFPDGCTFTIYENKGCNGAKNDFDSGAEKNCIGIQDRWAYKMNC
ncbi:hypothetical protein DM02DRAFT_623596 [Periconia macrospinosa]|uniref:Uncharacterized protein n=1 Tax=Periconia macrospinosa TaxID=97972 RepID=A0A2V1E5Y9_9PLEO|nr:hypothetical protein DM02DRAFT_623596 [Periconia macrospinosa]